MIERAIKELTRFELTFFVRLEAGPLDGLRGWALTRRTVLPTALVLGE